MENEQIQPSIISLLGVEDSIQIEFADGIKTISASIVNNLGKAYFEERTASFKKIEFGDFLNAYNKMRQKQQLNQFQANFIGSHFGQMY